MRWPIRNQIFVPFAVILLAAVVTTAVSAALVAARRTEQQVIGQLNRVIDSLGQSHFPFSQNQTVLEKMRALSGAEFVAFDGRGQVVGGTLSDSEQDLPPIDQLVGEGQRGPLTTLDELPTLVVDGESYFAAGIARENRLGGVRTLLLLYPEASWRQARWEAAVPPLAVGSVTLGLLALAAMWIAQRFSRRLRLVEQHVASIANGDFCELPLQDRDDEIQELMGSVNRMSRQLQQLQTTIQRTERARLLGQLAGGLAHQLRNAVTGARLAVQLHQRRCPAGSDDESLSVVLRQLSLTEEQIKGLLSVGQTERPQPIPRPLATIIEDVMTLVRPNATHAETELTLRASGDESATVADSEGVRTAVLNLVLNAVEAAPGGEVSVLVDSTSAGIVIEVVDDGPGPPAEIADNLFDVFVTGKPEGVGFGLALARKVAEERRGTLSWERGEGHTRFRLELPRAADVAVSGRYEGREVKSDREYGSSPTTDPPLPSIP